MKVKGPNKPISKKKKKKDQINHKYRSVSIKIYYVELRHTNIYK